MYDGSPLPPVSKSTQLAKFDVHETDDDDPAALSMVVPTTKAPASTPAACVGVASPGLRHPVEPSRDLELGMEYYSQQHRQEYFLTQGRS